MRAWGIATVSAMSQQTTSKLEFKALDRMFFTNTSSWNGPGWYRLEFALMSVVAPSRCDAWLAWLVTINAFVRTVTATLCNDWTKLMRSRGKTTVEYAKTSSKTTLECHREAGSNNTRTTSSEPKFRFHQGPVSESQSHSRRVKSISIMPDSSIP